MSPAAEFHSPNSLGFTDLVKAVFILVVVKVAVAALFAPYVGPDERTLSPEIILCSVLISNISTFCVSWYFLCCKYGVPFAEGFSFRKVSFRTVVMSLCIAALGVIVATVLLYFFGTGESKMSRITSTPGGFTAIAVLQVVVPFFEEIYYRGFIIAVIRQYVGNIGAVVVVTVWFGLVHVQQLLGDPVAIVVVTALGAAFTIQRYVTKSIVPSIVTHFTYNVTLLILALVGSEFAGGVRFP